MSSRIRGDSETKEALPVHDDPLLNCPDKRTTRQQDGNGGVGGDTDDDDDANNPCLDPILFTAMRQHDGADPAEVDGDPGPDHDEDDDCIEMGLPTPPDGGWGWAVVFSSFMIHVIADGITYSFGTFLVPLMKEFNVGRSTVSLIPSILVGITLGVGPIASLLVNRFGCRSVTIFGALLATFGIAVSAAANSVAVLYMTFGICAGIGFGFIYLPAIIIVSMYFEKKRAFATGIAVCGSGLGTFVFAPLTQKFIDHSGWRGAFLIIGAIVLTCVLFGALFRPLTAAQPAPDQPHLAEEAFGQSDDFHSKNNSFCSPDQPNLPPEIRINNEPLRPFDVQMGTSEGKYSAVARMALSHPVISSQPVHKKPILAYGSHSRIYEKKLTRVSSQTQHQNLLHPSSTVVFRKDIFYTASLYNIPEYKSNPRRYSRQMVALHELERSRLSSTRRGSQIADLSGEPPTESIKICGCVPVNADVAATFYDMMDLSLLKNTIFITFAISNFLTSIGFNAPYVYTVDRALLLNISEDDGSFLLSVVGIANTISRIVLGFLSDRQWINRLYLYNCSLAICGISCCLSNFCTDYTSQAVFCAVFGVTSGAYVGLTSVVLVDLLGLHKLTNAFGILLLFQGIASVMGPPLIGWLYDSFNNYDIGFYFAGTMILISGVMLFILPCLQRRIQNKSLKQPTSSSSTAQKLIPKRKKPIIRDQSFLGHGIAEVSDEEDGQHSAKS